MSGEFSRYSASYSWCGKGGLHGCFGMQFGLLGFEANWIDDRNDVVL